MQTIGTFLARAYVAYGMGLLALAYLGGNLLLLVVLTYVVVHHRRARLFRLAAEVFYGLLNPLVYLVVLRPGFVSYESPFWQKLPLQTIAWLLLAVIWTMRLVGAPFTGRAQIALLRRSVLFAGIVSIVLFGIKDLTLLLSDTQGVDFPGLPGTPLWRKTLAFGWLMAALAPLYLIPLVLAVDHVRSESETAHSASFFLLRGTSARMMGLAVAAFGAVSLVVAIWWPSDEAARRATLAHRDAIKAAASEYDVDPAVIASIAYVTARYQITPFRGTVERLVMTVWLWDPTSNFLLGPGLNISIGLTQIKPVTAQTAGVFFRRGGDIKQHREVPRLSWSPANERLASLEPPWQQGDKAEIVNALLDDGRNLRTCALILALYQIQWETDPQGSTIRGRPDLLGTLFQIGFERSHPKASPQSNAFGRLVQEVHDRAWVQEAFR